MSTYTSSLDKSGVMLFIKYALAPNKLRFCGPSDHRAIFDYFAANQVDEGLLKLLGKFEGAYPYLEYIAQKNKIKSPFCYKVVEAYWIGNELLNNISINDYYDYLKNRFKSVYKISKLQKLFDENRKYGAKPHHSFHVFSTFIRKKSNNIIIKQINNCLIMQGRVTENKSNKIKVEYRPIIFDKNKLKYGRKILKHFSVGTAINIAPDDMVSFHWGEICDVLDKRQSTNLVLWTNYHLNYFNINL